MTITFDIIVGTAASGWLLWTVATIAFRAGVLHERYRVDVEPTWTKQGWR